MIAETKLKFVRTHDTETRDIFGLVNFIAFPVQYLNEKSESHKSANLS